MFKEQTQSHLETAGLLFKKIHPSIHPTMFAMYFNHCELEKSIQAEQTEVVLKKAVYCGGGYGLNLDLVDSGTVGQQECKMMVCFPLVLMYL